MTVEESKVKSGRPALHSTVMWKTQILLNTEKKKNVESMPLPSSISQCAPV